MLLAFLVLLVWAIAAEILADYEYEKTIGSYWELADKASTLPQKADYLNRFVTAIEANHITGHNAIWLKTPDNSVDQNMVALHSLQQRMAEIRNMDVSSFAYQQAIQQITAQEQGEAKQLLDVIAGAWYLQNHPFLWNWIDFVKWVLLLLYGSMAIVLTGVAWN